MNDYASMQGLAQVLQKPNMGNLYALGQIKQRQQAQEAEMAQKKQQQDAEDFQKQIKLGELPVLESKMTQSLVDARNTLLGGLNQIYANGERNGFTPEHRRVAMEMRQKYQAAEDQAQAFQHDVDQLKTNMNQSLPILNTTEAAKKYQDLANNAFTHEPDGSISFNKDSLIKMRELPNDPSIYDPLKMADVFVKHLGTISRDIYSPDANLSDQQKYSNVFMTDKQGKPVVDPKTGRPLVNTSPEAIAQWNSQGDVAENVLRSYADKNFNGNVQKAFGSLMGSVADYSSVKTKINSPTSAGYNNFNAPQLSNALTQANNSLDEIRKNGGVSGYSGKEANLQWFGTPDQRTVRLNKDGHDVDVEILKFGIGNTGKGVEKGIWGAEVDPKGKGRKSVFIPIRGGENDPNLKTVLDASLKFDKKGNVRNDVLNQFREVDNAPTQETKIDEGKVSQVVNDIGSAFQKTDNRWPSDEDAASVIKDKLNSLGVNRIKTTTPSGVEKEVPLKVTADVANWYGSHKVSINGTSFDLDEPKDVDKLTNLIHDNADAGVFNADKNSTTTKVTPESFDAKWKSLKSGESAVGPDGVTYTKK